MIFPKKCLGCPPFLGYICWPKVVGALLLLSAPLALLSFRRPCLHLYFHSHRYEAKCFCAFLNPHHNLMLKLVFHSHDVCSVFEAHAAVSPLAPGGGGWPIFIVSSVLSCFVIFSLCYSEIVSNSSCSYTTLIRI